MTASAGFSRMAPRRRDTRDLDEYVRRCGFDSWDEFITTSMQRDMPAGGPPADRAQAADGQRYWLPYGGGYGWGGWGGYGGWGGSPYSYWNMFSNISQMLPGYYWSSLRFKHDVQPLEGGLAELDMLQPRRFTYNGAEQPTSGFVAEELVGVLDEAVLRGPDGLPLGVDPMPIIARLMRAVQELKVELATLRPAAAAS